MMVKVEGMPKGALEQGVPWSWRSFGEFLDSFEGKLGVNAGFLVGHTALRRHVMGAASVGNEASAAQLDAMKHLLHESIDAGGMGFSTSLAYTHSDGDGQPVPSRWSSRDEVLSLCEVVSHHDGTTLELVSDGCLNGFSDEEIALFTDMSLAGKRAVNWNVLTIDSARPDDYHHQMALGEFAARKGARVVALTMPVLVGMNMSFRNYCALFMLPDWAPIMNLPDWAEEYDDLIARCGAALDGVPDPDLTVKLITHRFTEGSRKVLRDWYPGSALDMDEAGNYQGARLFSRDPKEERVSG